MKYVCAVCGYVYDDEREAIPFEELPGRWKCPVCGAQKSDFQRAEPQDNGVRTPAAQRSETSEPHLTKLTAGQLAALCTNLARGCEKQYRQDDAALFQQLGDYFTRIAAPVPDQTVQEVANRIVRDSEAEYPAARAVSAEHGDRGALRACTWGEKVTRMLSSLVGRYLEEGDALLAGTEIWVCTVCGFVYIGENPPALCPVCKVPSWKFEKIEGRNAV